jgi:Flp pilus assembly protein TadG
MNRPRTLSQRGQTLVIFVLLLPVLLLSAGLVADAGYGFSQQRTAQNAADFSAMAGTRVLGESITGKPAGAGTDANVVLAIQSVLSANHAQLVSAKYVDQTGKALGDVGHGIPADAVGVTVNAKTSWNTFFLGIIGINTWSAGTAATAVTQGVAPPGVMPVGINDSKFNSLPFCDPTSPSFLLCLGITSGDLESGNLSAPGGFGWLKFGAAGKCTGFGLGMIVAGCETSEGFLQTEVGPPPNSYGCCTQLNPSATNNFIGSLTGNKPVDLSYYIKNHVILWTPIWDYAGGSGANAYYHIVGFGAIVFTGVDTQHAKWLQGVRVSETIGKSPNAQQLGPMGEVQLVH